MSGMHPSFQQSTWKKLLRNKGAVFGLFIIALSLLLALFCYLVAPDHSPYANRMIVEIGGRKPGFTQAFLLIKKDRIDEKSSFFGRLFSGEE
ncbi:MAG: ABC transporter permease, partial [Chitinophagales bacterium]